MLYFKLLAHIYCIGTISYVHSVSSTSDLTVTSKFQGSSDITNCNNYNYNNYNNQD